MALQMASVSIRHSLVQHVWPPVAVVTDVALATVGSRRGREVHCCKKALSPVRALALDPGSALCVLH